MAKTSASAVTDKTIKAAHAKFSSSKQDMDDVRMAHATMVTGLEEQGIHKKALKLVAQLLGQDIAKSQDFLTAFARYSEVLGLNAKIEDQPQLGMEDEGPKDERPAEDVPAAETTAQPSDSGYSPPGATAH